MIDVEVKVDEKKMRAVQNLLRQVPSSMPKIMMRSINKTAASAKTDIARRIGKAVVLKQKVIKKNILLTKATYNRWQARLSIGDRLTGITTKRERGRIPLIHFGAKRLKSGVTYKISRTGGRKKITYHPETSPVFLTVLTSGHKGVFRRLLKKRLPILELLGPSIPGVFEKAPGVAAEVIQDANKKLVKNIDAQVRYILEQQKAG